MKTTQIKQLEKHYEAIENAKLAIEDIKSELEDAFSEKSEKWQEGEKGEEAQDEISNLEYLIDGLDDSLSRISELTGN